MNWFVVVISVLRIFGLLYVCLVLGMILNVVFGYVFDSFYVVCVGVVML